MTGKQLQDEEQWSDGQLRQKLISLQNFEAVQSIIKVNPMMR
jgi:hypothetical protein